MAHQELREDDGEVVNTHDGTTSRLRTSIVDLFVEIVNVGHGEAPDQSGPLVRSRRRVPDDGRRSGTSVTRSTSEGTHSRISWRIRMSRLGLLCAVLATVVNFLEVFHNNAMTAHIQVELGNRDLLISMRGLTRMGPNRRQPNRFRPKRSSKLPARVKLSANQLIADHRKSSQTDLPDLVNEEGGEHQEGEKQQCRSPDVSEQKRHCSAKVA